MTNTNEKLDDKLDSAFTELDVSEGNRASVKSYLGILRIKDKNTYEHSVRVGFLGMNIAKYMHLDPRVLLFAGMLHDVGKTMIDSKTLKKTENFDEKDMHKMRKHPMYSYKLLKDIHPFSAELALRHHEYQENSYPKALPRSETKFSKTAELLINFYSRLLSLADFYDAVTYRTPNAKGAEKRKPTKEEAKSILLNRNPNQKALIENLYANKIMGYK